MIITASKVKRRPAWYRRQTMRLVRLLVEGNPGFHRLVICVPVSQTAIKPIEARELVNPNIEPALRRLLGRILVLDEPVQDDDPWNTL